MKPNTTVITREGSLDGKKIPMGIHKDAMRHIMTVLTDLYSDQELAVIREYSTNAADANKEAGNNRPIEVTLPNSLDPFFKVRDHGVGLNVDDIREIYSQYGASTKRASDDFNGMLGLGCKSALSYTSQFTVTSVKNGAKTIVSVSRSEDGTAVMEVVDTLIVKEENSTEVVVPVHNRNTFADKANKFYAYWKPGTVLVGGSEPKRPEWDEIVKDRIYLLDAFDYYDTTSYIVMGNIPYPLENGRLSGLPTSSKLVIFVDIGEVSFPPSREALMYTKETLGTITKYNQLFVDNLNQRIEDDIQKAVSKPTAITAFEKWKKRIASLRRSNFTFKGEVLPDNHFYLIDPNKPEARDNILTVGKVSVAGYNSYSRYSSSHGHNLDLDLMRESKIAIVNFPKEFKTSKMQRDKMEYYFNENNVADYRAKSVLLFAGASLPKEDWAEPLQVFDWSVMRKMKLPSHITAPAWSYDGKYDVLDPVAKSWVVRNLTPKDDIVYWTPAENKPNAMVLTGLLPGVTLVKTAANRWSKLQRLYPKHKHLRDAIRGIVGNLAQGIDRATAINLEHNEYERKSFLRYDESKINDPDVKEFIAAMRDQKAIQNAKDIMDRYRLVNNVIGHVGDMVYTKVSNPFEKYVLADDSHVSETIEYMNFKFAQSKEKK